jgi:hypothetical protein
MSVVATCGGSTNVNGTYFQSVGFPSTYDRLENNWWIVSVVATCGGSTNVNGTYFQSDGFPSTYNRLENVGV